MLIKVWQIKTSIFKYKEEWNMNEIQEFLPFLIPLVVLELALLVYTLRHILTHNSYRHGNRVLWIIVVVAGMQFIGPVLYFLLGKEDG